MSEQRQADGSTADGVTASHSTLVYKDDDAYATDQACAVQYGLEHATNAEKLLQGLCSALQQERVDAISSISFMSQQTFETTLLGDMRRMTLHTLARCLGEMPRDSPLCKVLLTKLCVIKLEEKELAETDMQRILKLLHWHAPAAISALARQILDGQEDKETRLPLVPIIESVPRGVSNKMKQKLKHELTLVNYPVCFVCRRYCVEPWSVKILYCPGCMLAAHCNCCEGLEVHQAAREEGNEQGQVWCSTQCKQIVATCTDLVSTTSQLGYIPMTNLAAEFPKNLGISITAGTTELTHAQAKTILPAAINLLPLFHDDKRPVPGRRCVHLVRAFVRRQHPDWRYNNTMTLTLWALPAGAANVKLKDCLAVSTIVYRIQGKDLADVLYAGTHRELERLKLMQVAMLALQLQLDEMGVQRIFLDASNILARDKWLSQSMGFVQIAEADYTVLRTQYSLFRNDGVAARCMKLVPSRAALLGKLENTTPGVPEDLFKVRDGRRLQVTKQASTHGQSGVLLQTPEASCKQTTELAQQSSPPKRRRVLTSRMMTSDMYLRCDALRGSFSQATTSQ